MIAIFKHLKSKEWSMVGLGVIFIAAQVWLDLKLPDYMSEITQLVQTPGSAINSILNAGVWMLVCTLVSAILSIIVGYFAAKIAAGLSRTLRSDLFEKVESFSMQEINNFSTPSLITRSTNDIAQIQMMVAMGMQIIIKSPIMAVWAVAKMSGKSWQWTALTGGMIAFMLLGICGIMIFALPKFKRMQKLTDDLNRVTRENLTGIRIVRAYNAEDFQQEKFEGANSEFTKNNLSAQLAVSVIAPVIQLVMTGLTLGIYWIGAFIINASPIADRIVIFSDMVVFSAYAMQVVMSFMMLTMVFVMWPRAAVSAKRVNEVLNTKLSILDGSITSSPANTAGEIEFRDVGFTYPSAEEAVLKNISFSVKKGETVAFIGSTGSGKSTLINLIPRFYDVSSGQILVDGIDVKDYTQESLRRKIGYVAQRAVLFSGTVKSNVTYGDSTPGGNEDEAIRKAVSIAQSTDFVEDMDNAYDSAIAQGGTNISGGQKQRLSIARAIYRSPEIYIFDDSFSALDYKTDRVLRSALRHETSGITTLIVAQRIGTIKDADRIIVLDEGEIVGIGSHSELLQSCTVYKEIAYSQLSKEELGA